MPPFSETTFFKNLSGTVPRSAMSGNKKNEGKSKTQSNRFVNELLKEVTSDEYPFIRTIECKTKLEYGIGRFPDVIEINNKISNKSHLQSDSEKEQSFMYLYDPQPLITNADLYKQHLPQITPEGTLVSQKSNIASQLGGYYEWLQFEYEELNSMLKESTVAQREQVEVEQFYGNSIAVTEIDEVPILLFPGGPIMNHIQLCPLYKNVIKVVLNPTEDEPFIQHSLLSTIYQIAVKEETKMQFNPFEKYVGVRTMYHSNIYKLSEASSNKDVKIRERSYNLDLIEGIQYNSRPLDMAFNSALDLEVATIVQNGSVYLWDLDHGVQTLRRNEENYHWGHVEFAAHPRHLFSVTPSEVCRIDLRSPAISTKLVEESYLHGFKRHPTNIFHFAVSSSKHISLYDERYCKTPIFRWLHGKLTPPNNIVFSTHTDGSNLLLTQNLQGETTLYHYDNPTSHRDINILTANLSDIPSPTPKSRGIPSRISSIAKYYDSKKSQIQIDPESNTRIIGMAMCSNPLRSVLSPFKDLKNSDFTIFQISEVGDIFYQEYVYEARELACNLRLSERTSEEDLETPLWKNFREIKQERSKPESLISIKSRVKDIRFILEPPPAEAQHTGKIPAELAEEVLAKVKTFANTPRSLQEITNFINSQFKLEVGIKHIQERIDSSWRLFFSIHRNVAMEAFYTNSAFLQQMVSSHVVASPKDFFAGFEVEPKKEEIKEETTLETPTKKRKAAIDKKHAFNYLLEIWHDTY